MDMELELRATQRLRRNEQTSKTMEKKADSGKAPAKSPSAQPKDQLSISRQALTWLEQQAELDREREMRRQERQSDILSGLDSKQQALDKLEQDLDILSKCQKIAASIIKGNRVPPEDLKYLMEHDAAGYKLAVAMRREKKDPEDVESVLDEEDKKVGSAEQTASAESPSVSAPEPSPGGGETPSATE